MWQEFELEPKTVAWEDLLSFLVGERVDVRVPGRPNVSHRSSAPMFYTALAPLEPWHAPRWRRRSMRKAMDERFVMREWSVPLPPAERVIDFPKCGRCFAGLVCEFAPAAPAQ